MADNFNLRKFPESLKDEVKKRVIDLKSAGHKMTPAEFVGRATWKAIQETEPMSGRAAWCDATLEWNGDESRQGTIRHDTGTNAQQIAPENIRDKVRKAKKTKS